MKERVNGMKLKIVAILSAALLISAAIAGLNLLPGSAEAKVGASIGDQAADFKLSGIDGKQYRLSEVIRKHQATVVNFWATWCPPCRAEIPDFVRFSQKNANPQIAILAVNLQESMAQVKDFAQDAGMKFPVLTDTSGKVGNTYRIYAIPTTFFIDRKGIIRQVVQGSISYSQLETEIRALLKEK
jgi:cytochrome c biogenesis protein CcmG/thiol:disulfide interchange protein DsbE